MCTNIQLTTTIIIDNLKQHRKKKGYLGGPHPLSPLAPPLCTLLEICNPKVKNVRQNN